MQRAGDSEIAEVMPGPRRKWAFLSPAGHPAIDQSRIGGERICGAKPETFHYTWSITLEQDIGTTNNLQSTRGIFRLPQVKDKLGAAPFGDGIDCERRRGWPLDPQHIGTQIGKHHGAMRSWTHCREFHASQPGKRTAPAWLLHRPVPPVRLACLKNVEMPAGTTIASRGPKAAEIRTP